MASAGKNLGLYNKQLFICGKPSVYNRHNKVNLLAMVKMWKNETKDLKQQQEKQDEEDALQPIAAFSDPIFRRVTTLQTNRMNIPIKVNQYTLSTSLGRGAQGTVYLGCDTKRFYAIKVINCQAIKKNYLVKNEQLQKILRVEIDVLKALDHPNIIKMYEALYSHDEQRLFIVLEYCKKGSLINFVKESQGQPDSWPSEIRRICSEMAQGINHMHQKQITHRDIKSQNVLVNEAGVCKICDFNISAFMAPDQLEQTNPFIGTKLYNPPELILPSQQGQMYSAYAADVWSLAITFLELLLQKHPFSGMNIKQLEKALESKVEIVQALPGTSRDLIMRMLSSNWRQRPKMVDVINHEWFSSEVGKQDDKNI